MLKETLLEVLKEQNIPKPAKEEIRRLALPCLEPVAGMATVLTGIRRSGKSTLQAQLARKAGRAFYCNFEDTRLFELTAADFPAWLKILDAIAPAPMPVFLDEVQEIEGWQRLARTLLDRGRTLCVTGSNASLLGADLGRKLTGRHLSHAVYPFCYSEYLAFTRQKRGEASLQAFLNDGGFPLFLALRRDAVLRELLRDVVQRDVILRHHLRESRAVMNLALFLFAHTGQPFSLQTLTKNLGLASVGKCSQYVDFLQDAYLLFAVPKFSASFKKRVVAPPKYYAIDNGLRRVNTPQTTPDNGRRLENAVALELLRQGEEPTYAAEKDAWECDFVTRDAVYQVCWQLTEENVRREMHGLQAALAQAGGNGKTKEEGKSTTKSRPKPTAKQAPNAKRAVILTLNQKERLTQEGLTAEVLPAWEWLG